MRITIDIKDTEAPFLIELLEQLNYVSIIRDENFEVPEWHKEIVLNRIKTAKPENYISWKEMKKQLKIK